MREKFKSFFWGYFSIPIVFYAVNMGCQMAFVQGKFWDILLLTVTLTALNGLMFWRILTQRRFPIRSPWSLAFGAVVGLWHFFTPYVIVGSYWVWQITPTRHLSFTPAELKHLGMSFVNPALNVYEWQCDGSLAAVVLSAALFCGIILKPKFKVKK